LLRDPRNPDCWALRDTSGVIYASVGTSVPATGQLVEATFSDGEAVFQDSAGIAWHRAAELSGSSSGNGWGIMSCVAVTEKSLRHLLAIVLLPSTHARQIPTEGDHIELSRIDARSRQAASGGFGREAIPRVLDPG
jgi:hypothetical protein